MADQIRLTEAHFEPGRSGRSVLIYTSATLIDQYFVFPEIMPQQRPSRMTWSSTRRKHVKVSAILEKPSGVISRHGGWLSANATVTVPEATLVHRAATIVAA